ncbi:hypothetical protein [Actinokineospora globicatena]|uniref:Secreted protein n=1 Tax=Actinokineospora globicatena TaxID=103729 RepID=A0A9W6QFT0_9PSEU|nr:hypothetical protein [Actinokineospora globicatena]GLW79555.1 hypothetical protein Aglo01_40370 [Actinokineospora globicatena]GLW86035.1 hypothetical protein Aglo02_36740 [Actinokineospora globicatena]GLW90166.1 hypothetical protein Aglo03_09820 [Actinokineospora globicatena]
MRRLLLAVCLATAGVAGALTPAAAAPPPVIHHGPYPTVTECETQAQAWRDSETGRAAWASECQHRSTSQLPTGWYFRTLYAPELPIPNLP